MSSIKDQVAKTQGVSEVLGGKMKVGGTAVATPAGSATATEVPVFKPTFSFGGDRNTAEWFLDRSNEMAVVTDEDHNLALGIKRIQAFGASGGQIAFGTIANVTVETLFGTITGIQVRESQRNPGTLYIGTNSRKYEKEGQAAQYFNDVELSRPAQAQILSWIYPQLTQNS